MFRLYLFADLHVYSLSLLSFSVFGWSNASSSFDHLLSCRLSSYRDLILKLTVQWNTWIALLVYNYIHQPLVNEDARGLEKRALLELEELDEVLKGDKYWEVECAVVYGSAQTIRVVSQIYRERTIEEVSANEERLTSSNLIKLIG